MTVLDRRGGAMKVILALLEARTGQQMAPNREWRIETALKPVMRERGLASLDALAAETLTSSDPALSCAVVDALLNQESSFFRDAAVLDMVVDAIAAMRAGASRRLRVWSAGTSFGQEPLSLAMLFAERGWHGAAAPEIVATDVSDAAVIRARAGRYSQFEIQRGLPVRRMLRWFDETDGEWIAKSELVCQIAFRRHNLVTEPPPIGRFDVVLCRNVLLYLSTELRRQVFDQLALAMRPGGLLVLGAGETVIGQTDAFRPSARYRGLYEPVGATSARPASAAA